MRNLCGDHEQTPLTLKVFTIFKLSSKQCGNNKHPQRTGRLFVLQQKTNESFTFFANTNKRLSFLQNKKQNQNKQVLYVFC